GAVAGRARSRPRPAGGGGGRPRRSRPRGAPGSGPGRRGRGRRRGTTPGSGGTGRTCRAGRRPGGRRGRRTGRCWGRPWSGSGHVGRQGILPRLGAEVAVELHRLAVEERHADVVVAVAPLQDLDPRRLEPLGAAEVAEDLVDLLGGVVDHL